MNKPALAIVVILVCFLSGYLMFSYTAPQKIEMAKESKVAQQSEEVQNNVQPLVQIKEEINSVPKVITENLAKEDIEAFKVDEKVKCSESQKSAGLSEEYAEMWCQCMIEAVITKHGTADYLSVMKDESRFSDFALKCQNSVLLDIKGPQSLQEE